MKPYFAGYQAPPWFARTHAVTLIPSAAALYALRQLPPGSNEREQMIGFGDPLFSEAEAAEAAADAPVRTLTADGAIAMRNVPLKRRNAPKTEGQDTFSLKDLPRLPDTAEELKSIARALHGDADELNLRQAANELTVKTADLSRYRTVVFATHGLMPGDLDGLHEPALALTAPEVAGVPGDGLLTHG